MNCPFCKSEYQSELLQEGRCPKCGVVVEWTSGDTDDFDAAKFKPKVTVDLSPRVQSHVRAQSRKAKEANGKNGDELEPAGKTGKHAEHLIEGQEKKPRENGGAQPPISKVADDAPLDPNQPIPEEHRTVRVDGLALPESNAPADKNSGVDNRRDQETAKGKELEKSTDVGRKVRKAWDAAAAGIKNTYSTIRTDMDQEPNGDSIRVAINERRMRGEDLKSFSADYSLLGQIGQGAVGVVYAAQQNSIDREVAVKMLQGDSPATDDRKEKFLFEAVVTGDLDHPNIVPIHDLGKNQKGDLFYSMKKIEGRPWSDTILQKSMAENLDILLKVCDAVAFAHSRGILHRDLKPENIMLGEYGEVLVVDWGIALPIPGHSKKQFLKFKPSISGTPAYMAPEMATGPIEKIGITSDVYLLGAILFEIVTSKPPHEGENALECVVAAAKNRITAVETEQEPISIARRALNTEPEDRYDSVRSFQEALNSYQSHIESITLSKRADASFEVAKQTRDYQDFSKAIFAYEEALELWPENKDAVKGVHRTNYEYAKCALEKSDFELGLSRVNNHDRESKALQRQLKKGALARDRRQSMVATLRNVAIGLVLVMIAGGVLAYIQQRNLLNKTETAKQEAQDSKKKAESALELRNQTLQQKEQALAGEQKARQQQKIALEKEGLAKQDAEKAKERAQESLERLREATYATNLDVAEERIEQNAFDAARDLIAGMAARNPGLLHWEWGRIDHLCNGLSELIPFANNAEPDAVQVIDLMGDNDQSRVLAIGESAGKFHLLFSGSSRRDFDLATSPDEKATLNDLQFSPNGQWVAVAGKLETTAPGQPVQHTGIVRMWNLADLDQPPIQLPFHGNSVTAIEFAKDGKSLLSAGDDKTIKRWSMDKFDLLDEYAGHGSIVWDIDFDSSGSQFVTSGDKDVRIWKIGVNRPVRRFPEHRCAVTCVQFIDDGKVVLSGDTMGRLFRWTVEKSSFLDFNQSETGSSLIQQTKDRVKQIGESNTSGAPKLIRDQSDTQILLAHQSAIRDLRLSNDGQGFLTAGDDNVVRIWKVSAENFPELKPVKELRGHGSGVWSAVFDIDDRVVYSGGQDRRVRKWSVDQSLKLGIEEFANDDGRILSLAVSPDRKRIALGKSNGSTELRDVTNPASSTVLSSGHDYLSTSTVLTPDQSKLITAAGDNTARIWDFQKGIQTRVIENTGRRGLLSLSGNGKYFATGQSGGNAVQVFDWDGENPIQEFATESMVVEGKEQTFDLSTIDLSETGKFLVAGDSYGYCYLWDVAKGTEIARWKAHFAGVVKVAFVGTEDEKIDSLEFITAGRESLVASWKVDSKNANNSDSTKGQIAIGDDLVLIKSVIATGTGVILSFVEFDSDRKRLAIVQNERQNSKGANRVIIETLKVDGSDQKVSTFDDAKVHSLCFSDAENLLIAASPGNGPSRLYRWNYSEENLPKPYVQGKDFSGVNQMLLVPDSNELLTVGGKGVQRWSLKTGDLQMDYRSHAQTNSSAFSPDGRLLVTGGSEGAVTIWELETNRQLERVQHPQLRAITDIQFVTNDQFIISDQAGQVFRCKLDESNMDSCQLLAEHTGPVSGIQLNKDLDLLVTSGTDGNSIFWQLSTGEKLKTLEGKESINCIALSPNARILATGTGENNIFLWNVESGNLLSKASGHSGAIASIEFSLDGLRLLSVGLDATAILWDLTPMMRLNSKTLKMPNQSIEVNEIFSISSESTELLGGRFVNGGSDILTANKLGFSLIEGKEMTPAFRVSRNVIEVERDAKQPVDSSLVVAVPNLRQADNLMIEMTLVKENGEIVAIEDCFEFKEESDSKRKVVLEGNDLQYVVNGSPVGIVGQLISGPGRVQVKFDLHSGYLFAVDQVLRSITLDGQRIEDEKLDLNIQLSELKDGVSNSLQSQSLIVRIKDGSQDLNEADGGDSLAVTSGGVEGQ